MVRPCQVTSEEEIEFKRAMEAYKAGSGRQFPTWSEILEVIRGLGYAKRIWRPVEPAAPPRRESLAPAQSFKEMGLDASTGLFGWYSRVETPAGS